MEKVKLSVIIPARNEENNIDRCVNSLSGAIPGNYSAEIILVDCSSSDNTILKAKSFPIKILGTKPDWPQSPAAARYLGTKFATGDFIFFIDADMKLERGFLDKAMRLLDENQLIAGISGIGKEIYIRDNKEIGYKPDIYQTDKFNKKATFLGGAALYRKSCLDEIGGFNPYLRAGEERELAQRLRKKGYDLLLIPFPMICHYTALVEVWDEFLRQKRTRLFLGIGEAIRSCHSFKFLAETLFYYKEFTLFLIISLYILLILTYSLFTVSLKYIYFCLLPYLILYIFLAVKKQSFKKPAVAIVKWLIISSDIMRGISLKPKDPSSYPTEVTIIQGEFNV
ncbi:MAG: glycosyltransferase family A protein [Candidatus Omnitrophota bacterium]